ncbi:MAG: ABC transporter substrate-binding protein [Alphaproteobacteria bacterium]|nr:ABC transporter substrate-binding protein [Alphaproteobacteria bacterium]
MSARDRDHLSIVTRRGILGGATAAAGAIAGPIGRASAQAGAPRKGGTLRVNYPGPPDSIDPHLALSLPGQTIAGLVFEGLTDVDAKDLPVPRLATSWQAENGAREWVFELRQGVRFHHGTEMTSRDVVATIERSEDRSLSLRSRGAFGPLKEARAEGPHRVRIVLTQPCSEMPALLANRWAKIAAHDQLATLPTRPSGTGPFMLKEFQPGVGVQLERHPSYWMPDRPYLDGIRITAISESIAQQSALRGNTVDLLEMLASEALLPLRRAPNVNAHSVTVGQYYAIFTQSSLEPFTNPKVREAFKYILNRRPLLMSSLLGEGSVANDLTLPPGNAYVPPIPQRDQDLPRAQRLLAEAGVRSLAIECFCSSERQPSPKIALALKEEAAKIGVTVTVRDIPYTEYVATVARKKPLYISQWNDRLTLYESLYQIYHSKQPFNYGGTEVEPGTDALLENLIAEVDFEKRKALAAQAMERIHRSSERIIPFFMNYMCAASTRVQNYRPPLHGAADYRDVWLSA